MRAFSWVLVGGVALSCGGSTAKHRGDDAAEPEPTTGGTATTTSAWGGAGPSVGGSTTPQAGTSVGANADVAGAPEMGGAAGEAGAAPAPCEKIPGFAESGECEPPADIAASHCPQQIAPNEGQSCLLEEDEYDCYYTLCPGQQQPFVVATCGVAGWRYTKTCNLQ